MVLSISNTLIVCCMLKLDEMNGWMLEYGGTVLLFHSLIKALLQSLAYEHSCNLRVDGCEENCMFVMEAFTK